MLSLCVPSLAAAKEVRALWVTRWDYRTPEDVRAIVRNAASVGFNCLYFQVRGEATCFFKSEVEPWAWELAGGAAAKPGSVADTGRDPGWDPLARAIAEAKQLGVELHAYMNVLPAWKREETPPPSSGHIYVTHPEWLMVDERGRRMTPKTHKFYAFLNPALPEVRKHLISVFGDVARRYPGLAGIHLDYIRYPGDVKGDFSHDSYSLEAFKRFSGGLSPRQAPEQWQTWRAKQINLLAYELSREIRRANPALEVSAAVVANYERAPAQYGQRSLEWAGRGFVDTLVPMAYHHDEASFQGYLNTFLASTRPKRGKIVVGIYPNPQWAEKGYTLETMARQIALARRMQADGVAIFSYQLLFPDHQPNAWAKHLQRKECFGASP